MGILFLKDLTEMKVLELSVWYVFHIHLNSLHPVIHIIMLDRLVWKSNGNEEWTDRAVTTMGLLTAFQLRNSLIILGFRLAFVSSS